MHMQTLLQNARVNSTSKSTLRVFQIATESLSCEIAIRPL